MSQKEFYRLPDVKRKLLDGRNQNIVDAFLENDKLVLVTEPYIRSSQDGTIHIVTDLGMHFAEAKEINDLNRIGRDKWSFLKEWLEKEIVKKYNQSNNKYGDDRTHSQALARGMDEVLLKMEEIEKIMKG
ncbi:hypothetical protein [Paenibacillus elgii]|uniref:hypothetical protein n=1 Tax=Paenibacillus elgii TaxID=189691 RepID=UPI000248C6CF|nr:hypothetical protein [Paenibacillus elgii]